MHRRTNSPSLPAGQMPAWLRRPARNEQGVAMAAVALLGGFLVLLTVVVAARTMAESRSVSGDRSWEQAIHVAESGVDQALFDLNERNPVNQPSPGTPLDSKDEVVAAAAAFPVVATPEGEVVSFTNDDETAVYSVGYTPNRADAAKVRAVEVEVSWATFGFPKRALTANGDVKLNTNGGFKTEPSPPHEASVHSNGNIDGGGTDVDGDLSAVGIVNGGNPYGTSTSGAPPAEFPPQDEVDEWQASLKAEAMTGPTVATLSGSVDAPVYVVGTVVKNGGTITVNGPGVVYIEGDLQLGGKAKMINNGATIAVVGTIDMTGQTLYEVKGDPALAGLVSFSTNPEAIKIAGQGTSKSQGFVYAANGGIKVTGDAEFVGGLVAKGPVQVSGNGGIVYPADLSVDVGPRGDVILGDQLEVGVSSEL